MCNEETNDKACCCCAPSYVGVIIFGVLVAIWWILNIIGMAVPGDKDWSGNELTTEEMEANAASALFNVVL